jgi:hypothetical protein
MVACHPNLPRRHMQFHLPRPLHGWRESPARSASSLLGVLIALAAQSMVEDWQWRQKVVVVRQSVDGRAREQSRAAGGRSGERSLQHPRQGFR